MTPTERLAALRAVATGQVTYGAGQYEFPPTTSATVLHQLAVEGRAVQYNHDTGAVELTDDGRAELAVAPTGPGELATLDEQAEQVDASRDVLAATVLTWAAEQANDRANGVHRPGLTRHYVDAAAREHATALGTTPVEVTGEFAPITAYPWLPFLFAPRGDSVTMTARAYNPQTLAPGSVIVANRRIYVCHRDDYGIWWMVSDGSTPFIYINPAKVPHDGVLVIDGAALGGA